MFGASNNAFGGFNTNNQQPQQQQQQQPTTGLFGAAAPSTTPFNAFGQQPAPTPFSQQPQSTGFGNNAFGTQAPSNPFGATPAPTHNVFAQPQPQTSNIFGASSQPQTSSNPAFGGFGATPSNTFGTFGSANNTTNTASAPFGQKPAASAAPFGTPAFGTNVFSQNTGSTFGAAGPSAPTNGTANPPYAPVTLAENESTPSQKSTFNSIVAMDAYKNFSFEELRFQDYLQGRKTAVSANTLATGFGTQQQQAQTGAFGSFGNNNTQVGAFGQPQPSQTNLFGGTSTTGTFGAQPAANRNIFGQPATNNPSPFNQPQTAALPSNTFGGTTTLFGSNAANPSPFGAQAAKPNIFGAASTQPAFGTSAAAPTTGIFGSTPAQPQNNLFGAASNQNSGGGLFGNNNNTTSNPPQPTGGLFGTNNNQNNASKPGGIFGASPNTGTSLFGQQPQPSSTSNSFGFSLNNQQQPTGGLFGSNNLQPSSTGGTPFGINNNQPAQTGTGGGLFGNNNVGNGTANTGVGLFGNSNPNTSATSGGLFGQKPSNPTGSLFGNKDATAQNNNNTLGSANLFGSSLPGMNFGLANNSNNNSNGNNLFGSSNNQQMLQSQMGHPNGLFQSQQNQQPMLQARVDQDAYGNNPLFANHGMSAGSRPAIPIRKQLPTIDFKPLPRPNTKITKLRGFARSVSPAKSINSGNNLAASTVSTGSTVASRSSAYMREEPLLSPKAFIVKSSPKKLTIDPSTLSTLFRNRSTTLNGSPSGTPPPSTNNTATAQPQPTFDPDAEASAQNEFSKVTHISNRRNSNHVLDSATSTGKSPANQKDASNASGFNHATIIENDLSDDRALMEDEVVVRPKSQAKAGEYWTLPSIDELRFMKRKDLKSIPGFKAGRVGYGHIEFQENVDLSGIANLAKDLCGEIIVFKQSICSVYPDDPIDKPPVGKGLNVPAVITLDNCWTLDKATRMPIKDPNHARVKLFMKRLMKSEDTDFIEYDAPSGKWTFSVKHFTTYGIDDSDQGSDDEGEEDSEELDTESYTDSDSDGDLSGLDHRGTRRVKPTRHALSDTDTLSGDHENDGPPREMLFEDEQEKTMTRKGIFSNANESDERFDHESTASVTGSDELEPELHTRQTNKKRPRQGTDPDTDPDHDKSKQAPNNADWRNKIGLESRKVAVMQASLFARTDSVSSQVKTKPIAPLKPMATHPQDHRSARRIVRGSSLLIPPHEQPHRNSNNQANIIPKSAALVPPAKKNSDALVRLRCPQYIPLSKSLASSPKVSLKNFSLSMARTFRVSWVGQCDKIVHPARGEIGNMVDSSNLQNRTFGDLAISSITRNTFELPTEIESAQRLLEVQLKHTSIHLEEGIPTVVTNPNLRFRDFLASYDKADGSNNVTIWGLCSALFDELKLSIPPGANPQVVERIKQIRREDAFSRWLERTVAPSVEQDVRSLSRQQGRFSGIFKLLTGNQIERACELAIQKGNYRLATLIAQCRRSDSRFKTDLVQQNLMWRQLRVDAHIDRDLRKTYELISGNATVSRGSGKKGLHVDYSEDINISEGLDWKRTLGLHIWFSAPHDNFWSAIKTYEDAFEIERCAPKPVPWYLDPSNPNNTDLVLNRWKLDHAQPRCDAMFQIMKMFVDPTYSLESVLEPTGFGPSPFDYLMPWHLYILISRVMRLRDFEDRELILNDLENDAILDDEGSALERSGSVLADLMTSHFSDQLVNLGLLKWAAFVLLHLETPASRIRAIEELLFRNIKSVSADVEEFLINRLKIPSTWISLARAQVAHHERNFFEEHRLLMESSKIHEAHKIAILELAPEAILRGDLKLIRKLLCGRNSNHDLSVDFTGGAKILMDFVQVMEGLQLINSSNSTQTGMTKRNLLRDQIDDTHKKEEIEDMLQTKVSNLIQEIPLVFHELSDLNGLTIKQQVCVNEMMSNLINLIESNPDSSLRPSPYHTGLTNHHYHKRQLKPHNKSYLNNHQNLINVKNLKISDQVLFIQNYSHKNFLKSLDQFSSNGLNAPNFVTHPIPA